MSVDPRRSPRLSLAQKLLRLRARLRDPEWRRYGRLLLAGKAIGVGLVLLIVTVISGIFFSHVLAADAEVKAVGHGQPGEHCLDPGRRFPRVRHAGRLHHAGSGLLPLP